MNDPTEDICMKLCDEGRDVLNTDYDSPTEVHVDGTSVTITEFPSLKSMVSSFCRMFHPAYRIRPSIQKPEQNSHWCIWAIYCSRSPRTVLVSRSSVCTAILRLAAQ